MESFVRTLLGVSLTGGIFILAAILVRSGVKHRFPKHFLVLLWAAVLVHLLSLPGMPPSPTSIYNYVALRDPVGVEQAASPALLPASDIDGMAIPDMPPQKAAHPEAAGKDDMLFRMLFYIWASGAAALFIVFLGGYIITMKRFDSAFLLKNNPAINNWLKRRKNPPKVFASDRTTTPLSYGLLRPRIVLPSDFDLGNTAQVESVLEHEYVHGRNYHNIMKFLVYLSLALHWFNPLAWAYWFLFNHDLELACDEQVIAAIGPERRAEYAHSLVAVAERAAIPFPLVSAFSIRSLKERIVDVMGYKRTTISLLTMEVLLIACLFALFGTTAATSGSRDSPAMPDSKPRAPATRQELPGWSYPEDMDPSAAALSFTGGVVIKQEIDIDNGRTEYEFKILSGNQEYKVKIDPRTRSVIEFERKDAKKSFSGIDFSRFISMAQAVESARETAPGGIVSECEFQHDKLKRFVYKAEIFRNGKKHEATIDAVTGRTLGVRADSGKHKSPMQGIGIDARKNTGKGLAGAQ